MSKRKYGPNTALKLSSSKGDKSRVRTANSPAISKAAVTLLGVSTNKRSARLKAAKKAESRRHYLENSDTYAGTRRQLKQDTLKLSSKKGA